MRLERDKHKEYVVLKQTKTLKYEHVAIVEEFIGRSLNKNETVHHINGIKNDNRIENLFVCSRQQHDKAHGMKTVSLYRLQPYWVSKVCSKCARQFYGNPKTIKDRKRCSVSCKPIKVDKECLSCGNIYTIPIQHTAQWLYCSRKCKRKVSNDSN